MLSLVRTVCLFALAATTVREPARLERVDTLASAQRVLKPNGQPRMIHFWAMWCEPCREELPRQIELARRAKAAGIDVVLVDLDDPDDEAVVRAHLANLNGLEVARHVQLSPDVDPDEVARGLDRTWPSIIPATFGLRASGDLAIAFHSAMSEEDGERLLRALLPPRAAARSVQK